MHILCAWHTLSEQANERASFDFWVEKRRSACMNCSWTTLDIYTTFHANIRSLYFRLIYFGHRCEARLPNRDSAYVYTCILNTYETGRDVKHKCVEKYNVSSKRARTVCAGNPWLVCICRAICFVLSWMVACKTVFFPSFLVTLINKHWN